MNVYVLSIGYEKEIDSVWESINDLLEWVEKEIVGLYDDDYINEIIAFYEGDSLLDVLHTNPEALEDAGYYIDCLHLEEAKD